MSEKEYNLRPKIDFVKSREEFCAVSSARMRMALEVASQVHAKDIRVTTQEPYVNHCMAVAEILKQWGADEDTQIAGLLHDTVEDHPDLISLEQVRQMFGDRVTRLVDGVTNENTNKKSQEKVAREAQEELGIILLKCADRLHNLSTMNGFDEERKRAKAQETLEFYVPLAESLGLWQVKNALADIAFSFAQPERYQYVKEKIDQDPRLNSWFISRTGDQLSKILSDAGVKAVIEHQVGGYWELSEKQIKTGKRFEEITDVVSFRVLILDEADIESCYTAREIIRERYRKLLDQERSDDYLVMPAMNGYSALHDTYRLNQGNIEVAFTTVKKERFNNWGIASMSDAELKRNPDRYKTSLKRAFQN
jgi:GTP pyrophosphokinase